jgi:hypothetical protein
MKWSSDVVGRGLARLVVERDDDQAGLDPREVDGFQPERCAAGRDQRLRA